MKDNTGIELTRAEISALEETRHLVESDLTLRDENGRETAILRGQDLNTWYEHVRPTGKQNERTIRPHKTSADRAGIVGESHTPRHEFSWRKLAVLLCQTSVKDPEYKDSIEHTLETIKALPPQTKLSMRIAYVFASKVPHEEREDCFQTFTATLLKSGIVDERLAYAVIRADWLDFWRAFKVKERARTTLESEVKDADGNAAQLGDLLIGEVEFENKMESTLDTASLWAQIPADMRALIAKRLSGQNLTTSRGHREPVESPLVGKNRKEYARFIRRGRPTTGAALSNTERSRFNRWLKSDAARLLLQDYAPRNTN